MRAWELLLVILTFIPGSVAFFETVTGQRDKRERSCVMKAISQVWPDVVSFKETHDQNYPDIVKCQVLRRNGTEFKAFLKRTSDGYEVLGVRGYEDNVKPGVLFREVEPMSSNQVKNRPVAKKIEAR
ncbi:hypothetical protein [Alicyclobacillus macrosporangiidus]|uniref:Uncharacterized protein n=1 Tax=Alicyclobacillus macrosporangiidus TaxID=392015 RepID=A0A1I7LJ77_9BACL|nr:hypothetical protein [Alicyclobacillus macrosporangiidus]SFV09693.1 hypothetical protein SAMN05421543_1644 [Alicyclobacillus macrosporangiidus]